MEIMKGQTETAIKKQAIVRYQDETRPLACPHGKTVRIVTGGEGGVANVHVVTVAKGEVHLHKGYSEVYYVLSGRGQIMLEEKKYLLKPGAVVVIPAGVSHSLAADEGDTLEFVIFGTPAMSVDDPRFVPIVPDI